MKKYVVEITETLQKRINVYANSKSDAISKIKQSYKNEEIVLDENDYIDAVFMVLDSDAMNR